MIDQKTLKYRLLQIQKLEYALFIILEGYKRSGCDMKKLNGAQKAIDLEMREITKRIRTGR